MFLASFIECMDVFWKVCWVYGVPPAPVTWWREVRLVWLKVRFTTLNADSGLMPSMPSVPGHS